MRVVCGVQLRYGVNALMLMLDLNDTCQLSMAVCIGIIVWEGGWSCLERGGGRKRENIHVLEFEVENQS